MTIKRPALGNRSRLSEESLTNGCPWSRMTPMGFWGETRTALGFGPVTMGVSQAHSVERGYKSPWSPDDTPE